MKNPKNLVKSPNAELQYQVLEASKNGVVALNEKDIRTLGIVFGKKNNVPALIQDVLFIAYKVQAASGNNQYFLERKLDNRSSHDQLSVISDSQANKIGLHDGVNKVKIGNDVYKVHYIDADELPDNLKNFALKEKAPKVVDEKFLTHYFNDETVADELSLFFNELRQWQKLSTSEANIDHLHLLDFSSAKMLDTNKKELVVTDYNAAVEVTGLAKKRPRSDAKEVFISDDFNIEQVSKTGYHFLSEQVLINEPDREFGLVEARQMTDADLTFSYQDSFKRVDNFWTKLVSFYDTNPIALERKLSQIAEGENAQPVFAYEQLELKNLVPSRDGKEILNSKLRYLNKKEIDLVQSVETLKEMFFKNSLDPQSSDEFVKLEQELSNLQQEKAAILIQLENIDPKLAHPEASDPAFVARNYINVYGSRQVLADYATFVSENVNDFDEQLNAIEFKKKEFEHLLVERLKHIHEARKAKAQFEIMLQDEESKRDLAAFELHEQERLRLIALAERGRILDNSALVRTQIQAENDAINHNISNLKEFALVENFEQRLQELKQKHEVLAQRKEELAQVLVDARTALLQVHRNVAKECVNLHQIIATLETETLRLANRLSADVTESVRFVKKLWNEKALEEVQLIFDNKARLLPQISDIISSQVERLSIEQLKQLELANERQTDWNKVYLATVQEYQNLNYYVAEPTVEPSYASKKDAVKNVAIEVGAVTEKLVNLDFVFNSAKSEEDQKHQSARNALLGLAPIMKDDEEFDLIDQVGELTEEQKVRLQAVLAEKASQEQAALAAQQAQELENLKAAALMDEKIVIAKQEELKIQEELDAEEVAARERLANEENEILKVAQYRQQLNSNFTGAFKAEIYDLARKLITKQQVELVNKDLVISDVDLIQSAEHQVFDEKNFFLKPTEENLFETTVSPYIDAKKAEEIVDPISDTEAISLSLEEKMAYDAETEVAATAYTTVELINQQMGDGEEIPESPEGLNLQTHTTLVEDDNLSEPSQTQEIFEEVDNLKLDLEAMKDSVAASAPQELEVNEALEQPHNSLTERTLYKIPLINLVGVKNRIQLLDEEISQLARYTSRQGKKIEDAIKIRDDLKHEFDKELQSASLDFDMSTDEIKRLLNQDIDDLVNHEEVELLEASSTDEINSRLNNYPEMKTEEVVNTTEITTMPVEDWTQSEHDALLDGADPLEASSHTHDSFKNLDDNDTHSFTESSELKADESTQENSEDDLFAATVDDSDSVVDAEEEELAQLSDANDNSTKKSSFFSRLFKTKK